MVNSEISVLFLSLSDVLEVGLTLRDAVEIVETSLREHGEKRVENPPKLPIHPLPEAFINAMPAFLPRQKICGLKWVAGFPTNVPKDLPTITAVMVLNDPETGMPLAFMDGTYITALRNRLIVANWPDVLRSAATMVAGAVPPSQLLRKFASYPRQHDLAAALREIGRVERTLFIIDWVLDPDMRRRAHIGLNKGESHHALKNALRIGRQGEIRDRSSEGQHYRMAGLNLLAAIVIYWNTVRLDEAVRQRKRAGLSAETELLAHISPLGWAHILLTGEYRWPRKR